jgi:20S proteasome alpha/beta subunit
MGTVIVKGVVQRKPGYLYYVDAKGNVMQVPMARGKKKGRGEKKVIAKGVVKRKEGYLYYIDAKGNVCEAKMAKGGRKKKKR